MVHLCHAVLCLAQLGSYAQVSVSDTKTELDSHTDTTAIGSSTTLVLHNYVQPVHVHGYTTDVAPDDKLLHCLCSSCL